MKTSILRTKATLTAHNYSSILGSRLCTNWITAGPINGLWCTGLRSALGLPLWRDARMHLPRRYTFIIMNRDAIVRILWLPRHDSLIIVGSVTYLFLKNDASAISYFYRVYLIRITAILLINDDKTISSAKLCNLIIFLPSNWRERKRISSSN